MNYRTLSAVLTIILLISLILAIWHDRTREWKTYQAGFIETELSGSDSESEQKKSIQKEAGIKQINIPALGRVDRCVSCHIGIDNAQFRDAAGPYRAHPGDYLKKHPVEKYGCTICHEGQGLATTKEAAHGNVKHWDKPMLEARYIQASCGKCHSDTDQPQMGILREGKGLFNKSGCIGCHAVNGWGGNISVDIGEIGDKVIEELDFTHVEGRHTVANWLYEHFLNPQKITPARPDLGVPYPSAMPNHSFRESEAAALTALMLSWTSEKKTIPVEYYVSEKPKPSLVYKTTEEAGRAVFEKFGCAGCHGEKGENGISNYNAHGGKVPSLAYVAEGYTVPELKDKVRRGVQPVEKADPKGPVPPLWMQKWGERITEEELDNLVSYLISILPKEEKW
jgi:mono/diheme cytochrome c family protein